MPLNYTRMFALPDERTPTLDALMAQRAHERAQIEDARNKFLSDPSNVEKILSHWAHRNLPEKAAGKIAVGAPLAKIESKIPEDDPRKGLASSVLMDSMDIIARSPGVHPTKALADEYVNRYAKLAEGDKLYKFIRESNSALYGSPVATAPGYEQWKKEEDKKKPEWEWTNPLASFGLGAGFSAVGGLAGKAAAKGMLGRVGAGLFRAPVPGPWGLATKAVGAGLMAIPAFAAFDVPSNIIRRSDWAQDRPWMTLGAELALGTGAAISAEKTLLKGTQKVLEKSKLFEMSALDVFNDPSLAHMNNYFGAHRDLFKAEDRLKKDVFEAEKFWAGINPAVATVGPARPREWSIIDTKLVNDLVSKGMDPEEAATKVAALSTKRSEKLFNESTKREWAEANQQRVEEFKTLFADRVAKEPDASPQVIAQQIREEQDFLWNTFNQNKIIDDAVNGFSPVLSKERKINPVLLRRELSQRGKETDAILEKHVFDYENPTDFASMPKSELVGRVVELNNARVRGLITEDMFRNLSYLPEKAMRERGIAGKKPIEFLNTTVKDIETPAAANALSNEAEKAIFEGDVQRYNDVLLHYIYTGTGKNADEVLKKLEPIVNTETARALFQKDGDDVTKAIQKLTQGDLGATKKALKKDLANGIGKDEFFAKYGKLGAFAGVGAVAMGLNLSSPDEANAGITQVALNAFRQAAPKATQDELLKKMVEKGYGGGKLTADGLGVDRFTKSINFTDVHGRTPDIYEDVAKEKFSKFWGAVLTPGAIGQFIFKPFSSAQPIVASKTQTAIVNADLSVRAVQNILRGFGDDSKNIANTFRPLVDKYSVDLHKYGELKYQLGLYDQVLSGKYRPAEHGTKMDLLSKKIKYAKKGKGKLSPEDEAFRTIIEDQRDGVLRMLEPLEGVAKNYNQEYLDVAKQAAKLYPGARIFYAANGMGMDLADPWVRNLMSHEEQLAAGRIKDLLGLYGERARGVGLETITSKDFMHYVSHPDTDWKRLADEVKTITPDSQTGIQMAKFHRRGFDTLPMMPSVHYAMKRYIPDAELRMEMASFWNEWKPFMRQAQQQGYTGVSAYMEHLAKGFSPEQFHSNLDKLANNVQMFEVGRLISLSPSVGFKHAMKVMANIALGGVVNATVNLPKALPIWKDMKMYQFFGDVPVSMRSDLAKAHIGGTQLFLTISDMLPATYQKGPMSQGLEWWNKWTNGIVNNIETIDRGFSFSSAVAMAAKQGMTPAQASYLIHDLILKANFLSGIHNPTWLRDPKTRLLFLFQGTPFKIAEQRAITAIKGGGAFADAGRELFRQMKADRKEGAKRFRMGLVYDALTAPKDLNGVSYAGQLTRMILTAGAAIQTGKLLGDVDIGEQVFHVPFTTTRHSEQSLALAMNPMLSAAYQTLTSKDDDADSATEEFIKKWLPTGPIPNNIMKAQRLTRDDIPEIYKDSKFKYFFGLKGTEE